MAQLRKHPFRDARGSVFFVRLDDANLQLIREVFSVDLSALTIDNFPADVLLSPDYLFDFIGVIAQPSGKRLRAGPYHAVRAMECFWRAFDDRFPGQDWTRAFGMVVSQFQDVQIVKPLTSTDTKA